MPKQTTLYRYLTGPDDASFCHRVSEALSRGWVLYGPPTLTYDEKAGRVIWSCMVSGSWQSMQAIGPSACWTASS